MDTTEVVCSSGLTGRVRKITGGDMHHLLTNVLQDADDDKLAELAERVWVETINKGPYDFNGPKPPFRTSILLGDRSDALIASRAFTTGPVKQTTLKCKHCGGMFPVGIDYTQLNRRRWPIGDKEGTTPKAAEAHKRFSNGEPCETVVNGIPVCWELRTGKVFNERTKAFFAAYQESNQSEAAARIVSIDSESLSDIKDEKERRKKAFDFVCGLTEDVWWEFWGDIQDHECGIETDHPSQCPYPGCGLLFAYRVSVADFILPTLPERSMRSLTSQSTQPT